MSIKLINFTVKMAIKLMPVTRAKSSKASQCVRLFLDGCNAVVRNSTKGLEESVAA